MVTYHSGQKCRAATFLLIMVLLAGTVLCAGVALPAVSVQAAPSNNPASMMASGYYHTLLVNTNGTLWAWGRNDQYQLGNGTTTTPASPIQIGDATNWESVAASWYHSLGVRSDGTLWAWGNNESGQLGTGDTSDKKTPTQVGTATDWVAVATGESHSLGIRSDGTLWAWGDNQQGQLGLGNNSDTRSPARVGTFTDWIAIAAGDRHSLGVRSDGTLWGWGYNEGYELGLGYANSISSPAKVGTGTTWVSVASDFRYSLGVQSDGTLWSWGWNTQGQLGLGDNITRAIPTRVGTQTDWVAAFPGRVHCLGVQADGTMWAWGSNGDAELGVNDSSDRWNPVAVGNTNNWVTGSAGDAFSCGVRSDGTVWGWGRNGKGQLGLAGDTAQKYVPTQCTTLTLDTFPPTVVTRAATSILANVATLNGYLVGMGTGSSAQVSFEWGPTTDYGYTTTPQDMVSTGAFIARLSNLTAETTYHYRAVAMGDAVAHGSDMTFKTTSQAATPPDVWTDNATGLTGTSAILNGNLISMGTAEKVVVYFEYGTDSLSYTQQTENLTMSKPGVFNAEVTGLASGTLYYFRTRAFGDGTDVGGELSFRTAGTPKSHPLVATAAADHLTTTSARLNGNLTDLGTATNVTVVFEWGAVSGSYSKQTTAVPKLQTGAFFCDVGDLAAGTTYYFRAKAVGDGTGYGEEKSFTVPTAVPAPSSVSPARCALGQSTRVTLTGDTFSDCVGLDMGPGITVQDFTVVSATQITATITIASDVTPGERDVTVTTASGSYVLPKAFVVEVPGSGGLPLWAWLLVAAGAVVVCGGVIRLLMRRKRPAAT